ncbi:MAG TPA: DUF4214 domain-containing protein [Pirellulales bacterium]|nr:DUF4214 domain-containing protein [Pirellulales bacterium]
MLARSMASFAFDNRTRQKVRDRRPSRRRAHKRAGARFERLEMRSMLSAVSWIGPATGGNWDVAANWSGHTVPGAGDTVTVNTGATAATIVVRPGDSEAIASLTTGANDSLSLRGGVLSVSATCTLKGPIDVTLAGARATLDYGVLAVAGAAALNDSIDVSLADGYSPGSFDNFQPLLFGSRTGTPTVTVPAAEADFLTSTSLYVVPAGSKSITVTTAADDMGGAIAGQTTLRDAIAAANASANPIELIDFDIPTGDSGYSNSAHVWTISATAALPALTGHAIIDATTQPGYVGKPVVQLSGASAGSGVDGLDLNGGHSRVSGLVINQFKGDGIHLSNAGYDTITADYLGTDPTGATASPNGANGVELTGASNSFIGQAVPGAGNLISGNTADAVFVDAASSQNVVAGNLIGTNATGETGLGNTVNGVEIRGFDNTVGGTTSAARNVVSSNGAFGIFLNAFNPADPAVPSAYDNLVEGNLVGTDATGSNPLGNAADGVELQSGTYGNTIGGTAPGADNVIAASSGHYSGLVVDTTSHNNTIEGNFIGTNAAGASLGNPGGVYIFGPDNTIGGNAPGAANTIANNIYGVVIDGGAQNLISRNSIFANTALGIDLFSGGNNNQAAPVLAAAYSGAGTTVSGSLTSAANTTYTVEFFANPAGTSQGQTYLGTTTVTTGAGGVADFNVTLPSALTANEPVVTATATDPANNTSAFSNAVTAQPGRPAGITSAASATFLIGQSHSFTVTTVGSPTPVLSESGVLPSDIKFVDNGNGTATLSGTPSLADFGVYTVTVTAHNGVGNDATQSFTLTVGLATQNENFLASVYLSILHRPIDEASLEYWSRRLDQGLPRSQVVSAIDHSAEYYAKIIITPAYEAYLGRAPDSAGVAWWTLLMEFGLTDEELDANFLASPEFYQHNGGTNQGWIDGLYEQVLGRPADQQGGTYWLRQLNRGESRYDIALGFETSQEVEAQRVTNDYQTFLGRQPSAKELDNWLDQLPFRATDEDVITALVSSAEYYQEHSGKLSH